MKKITMRRRMLSLTLAASVALPQASSAFAASLWNEDGENSHISQVIETGQAETQESGTPWVTLPPVDKTGQQTEPTVQPSPEETLSGNEEANQPEAGTTSTPAPVETGAEELPPAATSTPVPVDTPEPVSTLAPTPTPEATPVATEPAGEVTTPVPTPEITPAPTPESTPDQGETLPPEKENDLAPTATESPAPEEVDGNSEPGDTPASVDVDTLSFDASVFSLPENYTGLSQWMYYRLGYGVPLVEDGDSGRTGKLAIMGQHFRVESTETSIRKYGYRDYSSTGDPISMQNPVPDPGLEEMAAVEYPDWFPAPSRDKLEEQYNCLSLCVFPTAEALGRVPDQQFEGWYVYPSGAKANQKPAADYAWKWIYGDLANSSVSGEMRPIKTYPYESGDPGYDTWSSIGDTWDGGIDYGYGYVYMRNDDGTLVMVDEWNQIVYDDTKVPQLGDAGTNPVSIVGRWEASDESRASGIQLKAVVDGTEQELTLYSADISGKPSSEATSTTFAQGENSGTQEYWLRVPADVASLSLDLSTLELYYDDYSFTDSGDYDSYHLDPTKSHVQVTATFNGETTAYTNDLSARMLPRWDGATPKNSIEDPAHSEWSVSSIALENSVNGSLYNDITVTVTSPSRDMTTTYIFHVQRLAEPSLTQAYGNTPLGMIYRDEASGGDLRTPEKVAEAETYFAENRQFATALHSYPNGSANQDGTIFRDTYWENAWPETNDVDRDPNAIVVYQDSIFLDPGVSLTDSEGKLVDITSGSVSRSLKLTRVSALSPTQIGKELGEDCWYQTNGTFSQSETFTPIWTQKGTDAIDLREQKILPGIYTIEYQYEDLVSGKIYGSNADDYVTENGKNGASAFRRTLVVLPTPGDVDMDGAVTMADALALQSMLGTSGSYTTLNGAIIRTDATKENNVASNDLVSLFAYRVCDINHDGVVNEADVKVLRTLPNPKTVNETNASNSDYFYIALPSGESEERYSRKDLIEATTETAKIEMAFLGKEGGTLREGGYFDNPTGPWASDTTAGIEMGDIFWLGVKVSDDGSLGDLKSVRSFTFTVTYDKSYVTPAVVLNETNWGSGITGNESAAEQAQIRWESMMRLYNLGSASTEHTVWGEGWTQEYGSPYDFTEAAGTNRTFTTHYSTAVIPLEARRGQLVDVTFSVELRSEQTPVALQNGEYLFALPFRLIRHPFGQQRARLVEFEAGMRGFTLVGTDGTTYAYSAQRLIFGNSTQNLANILPYGNLGAEIPLGEDRTEVYQIYNFRHAGGEDSGSTVNAVYASPFLSRGGRTASGEYQVFTLNAELMGDLPPGLHYYRDNGYIDGIPEKAGTYEFYIGSTPYRLVVEKADLHFWAENQSSYYGQPEFRGTASDDFTFRYEPNDICDFERDRAEASGGTIQVDGKGSGLAALLDDPVYNDRLNQPSFTAVTEGTTAVTNATPVGTYAIKNTLEPKSTNYKFIYDPSLAGGSKGLTILPRPIQVVHINGTAENKTEIGYVYSDQPGTLGNRKAWQGASISAGEVTFTVRLATTTTDREGYYNGLPLTPDSQYTDGVVLSGDSLEITYSADYIRNQGDIDKFGASSGLFFLDGKLEEYRDVRVRDIRLTGGTGMSNYLLVSNAADESVVENAVVGKVLLRRILSMEISQLPPLEYHYGDHFTQSNELHYFIKKDGDVTEGQYRYSDSSVAELGITAYWASAEEKYCYENGLPFDYDNNDSYLYRSYTDQIFTMDYNGRHLCLSTPSVDGEGNNIVLRRYAEDPLVILPRDIVLTATSTRRYYGEDHQANLTFTYDPAQLAAVDRERHPGLTGAGEELETVLAGDAYVAPTLTAVTRPMAPGEVTEADKLSQGTRYTGSENSVIIFGASSKNYRVLYKYTNSEGVTTTQEGYGASAYRIERRPIVVEEIVTTAPLSEIYADTHRIYTDNLPLKLEDVALSLPEHTDGSTTYYPPRGNSSNPRVENIGFAVTDPVVNNDRISFTYTATMIPTDGNDYVRYIDFSRGYFNMTGVTSYREYPVQVSNLRLAGEDANNYTLVYKAPDRGALETPNQVIPVPNAINPEVNAGYTYYAAGVREGTAYRRALGKVWLRPIEKIEIISAGRLNYTYGERYDPSQGDRDVPGSSGMLIHIEYLNDEKNNYEGNPYIGEVSFRIAGTQDDQVVTTFDNRSLKIYYVKPGQSVTDVVNEGAQALSLQSALYVAEHNGAHLVVVGQRGGQPDPIVSTATTSTLKIEPKALTLRADDQYRVYGENNPTSFGFTFRAGDLAQWDRDTLGVTNVADRLSGNRLSELNVHYQAPVFGTQATPGSDVRNGGLEGYEITKSVDGSLDNYVFQYEPGTLYVYPRPVRINSFVSSGENPIYTIFSDVSGRVFWTNVEEDRFGLLRPLSESYTTPDGRHLPVTGDALYEGDKMVLRIRVAFPSDLDLHGSAAQAPIDVRVEDASIVAGSRAASNYRLVTQQISGNEVATIIDRNAVGKVELRNISTITIVHEPDKMNYTYGEALDLAGLQVRIDYSTGAGSGSEQGSTLVTYMGREQFEEQGLFVNYYDSPTLKDEYWGDIKENYRVAATGDHLTIAPTHDSQLRGSSYWFAAAGKYLVITAQRHESQEVSEPKIVPTPITVNPLKITFTLQAEDKIYNGNTQAAGTITFANIFNQNGVVDSVNTNGVTDLVYPVTGADYERKWGNAYPRRENFADFKNYVTQNGYSFTTGTYVANDPSILTENKTLLWTPGYEYGASGTLAFSYMDPNVAYVQETGHDYYGTLTTKEVQVTGLRLGGPDAANYTIVGQRAGQTVEVTTNNVTFAQSNGYQGNGLPTATIHKANRAAITEELLPQVEIDPHTNVVRVTYDQSLLAIAGGEESIHEDELHFEYALQQVVTADEPVEEPQPDPEGPGADAGEEPEEGTGSRTGASGVTVTDIVQWAGRNGSSAWGDTKYFGGEAAPKSDMPITSEDPEAGEYIPREEDFPDADSSEDAVLKGQVYQWSALDDGFVLDPSAYPGGVIWPGYELYTTDRTALERDGIYLAVVRAAETNNYNASPVLSSVEGYTAPLIQAVLEARQARDSALTAEAREQAQQALDMALQAVAEPLGRAVLEARGDAQAEVDALMGAGEEGREQMEERPVREAASAVKTYKQVIETVSLKELQSEGAEGDAEPYQVPTLEAIWFTDVEEISSKEVLDAVVWNIDPARYRTYAWDRGFTAELSFDQDAEPISLKAPFEVTVTDRREDGGEETESTIWVNEEHNARLYVDTSFPSGGQNIKVERIVLRPGSIMAALGDKPVALGVTLYPAWARATTILWTSSDPTVAAVDRQGRITFLGVGTAVITATVPGSYPGAPPQCSASITVTVVENWKEEYPNSIFDFGNVDVFLVSETDEGDKVFMPDALITRGEVAKLLAQFYVENPTWTKTGPNDFPDLSGEEEYADEAKLLGSLGVFMGYPEGDFIGDQYINRAEFVTLLARMTGLDIVDTTGQTHAFRDTGELDTWAYSEIDALSKTGILLGVGEGYFEPGRCITRSEVATLLTRLLRFPMTENGELTIPADVNEDHWARESILRAVNGSRILEESMLEEVP